MLRMIQAMPQWGDEGSQLAHHTGGESLSLGQNLLDALLHHLFHLGMKRFQLLLESLYLVQQVENNLHSGKVHP